MFTINMVQFKALFAGIFVLFVLNECSSQSLENKQRKTKKYSSKIDGFSKNLATKTEENLEIVKERPTQMKIPQKLEQFEEKSPCQKKHCGAGRVCKLSEAGEAECVCITDCPVETDPRRMVCSNFNETWGSDCEIHRMRCNCEEKTDKCQNLELSHLHVEYYGACKQLQKCSDSEMADFPRRMREWLYHIMQDLADREELSPHFIKMIKEGETNMTKRWSNAAVWKWCDLDGYPHDKTVSRHELFPIRAPLLYLEHCIAPFLNKCDENNDHMISLREWGNCLEVSEEILEEECEDLRKDLDY